VIEGILHQLFQVHYIHELLHLLSGFIGSFLGTWFYFLSFRKRRRAIDPEMGADRPGSGSRQSTG
jgi:hypothetical protein